MLDSGEHLYDAGDVGLGTGSNKGPLFRTGAHLHWTSQVPVPKCQSCKHYVNFAVNSPMDACSRFPIVVSSLPPGYQEKYIYLSIYESYISAGAKMYL